MLFVFLMATKGVMPPRAESISAVCSALPASSVQTVHSGKQRGRREAGMDCLLQRSTSAYWAAIVCCRAVWRDAGSQLLSGMVFLWPVSALLQGQTSGELLVLCLCLPWLLESPPQEAVHPERWGDHLCFVLQLVLPDLFLSGVTTPT